MKKMHRLILKSLTLILMMFMPTTLSAIVYSLYIDNPTASVTEGDYNGEKSISFKVYTGSSVQDSPYTFGYTVSSSGGATYPSDYTISSGSGSIAVGSKITYINVPLGGDLNPESDETITVTIYSEAEDKYKSATGTIVDNDSRSISISDASVTEGDSGTTDVTLTLNLSGNTASAAIPFTYSTIGNSAVATDDFTGLTNASGSFPVNATTTTITVPIVGDLDVETAETFSVKIATTSGVSISDDTAVVTINDNDKYRISIAAASNNSVDEGHSGTTNATYTISLNQPVLSGQTVSVKYTASGTGTNQASANDFTGSVFPSATVSFSATEQSKTITIPIAGDATPETDEMYRVTLSTNSANSTITTATADGTIKNDDSPTISVGAVSKAETNAAQTFAFPITLSAAISKDVDVYYTATIESGDSASTSDFTQITTPTKVTILAGATTGYANVSVAGDTLYEGSETFTVTLSSPVNGVLHSTNYTAKGTITNDDTAPTLSIANQSISEGNAGTKTLTFTINQSAASGLATTFNVSTSDGTAKTTDGDYVGFTNTPKTIAAGSTSTTINVTINGDAKYENSETFNITLNSPVNATGTPSATGTITNDDTAPTVTISPKSQNEGNSDNTMNFTVTLSAASGYDTTVTYKTTDGSATTSDTDYTGVTSGTVTIAAGATTGNAAVTIKGDNKYETDETFSVELTGATNATLHTTKTATGTIVNDDSIPSLSIADLSQNEGSGGGTTTFNLPVSLSNPSYQAISVKYSTSNGTADSSDFSAVSNATLNFAAGSTSAQNASVSVNADNGYEADETFTVTLSTPSNATINDSSATATIKNDDSLTLTITPATNNSVDEGNGGTTNATYTVTLSSVPLTSNVTVKYTVSGTGTNQAAADDFVGNAFPTATLTFLQNTTALTQTITIPINGDTTAEQDETYAITLSNASGATISGTNPVTGTIKNDDTPMFRIYVGSVGTTAVSTTEGDSGDQNVNFRVVMTAKPAASATVNYTIAQCGANPATVGTSATGKDVYRGTLSGTLTFTTTNWSNYQQLQVRVVGDTIQENDETYCVTLSNPNSYGTLHSDSQAVGTIIDNDTPIVYISSPSSLAQSSAEGTSATTNQNYTIALTKTPLSDVTVTYAAAGSGTNSATSGIDFTATSGTWTFPAGTTTLTKVISVPIKGDTTPEPNETYTFTLSNVINATLSTTAYQATGTILNDDTDVTINDITVTEGSCGDVVGNLTVTLSHPISNNLTVNYNSSGGTATENADYSSVDGGSITIIAGQTTGSIPVTIRFDDDLEPTPETFNVTISNSNSGGVTYSDKTGVVTINDNQNRDITTFVDQSVTEGDSGSQNMTFSVVLCQAAGQNYTFSYETADITAEDAGGATSDGHNDYDGTATGSFQITAGNTTGTFNIPINGDLKQEDTETFSVTVTPPSGITMTDTQSIGTIIDNDNRTLSISSIAVDEGHSGNTTATLRISSTQIADTPIVVNYSTRNGTATKENSDYVEKINTATIPIGQTFVDVDFSVVGDTTIESTEYFEVNISSPQGITVGTSIGTITINDDDNRTVILSAVTVTEEDSGTQTLQIPVTLSSPLSAPRTLYYYTTPITANQSDDSDYVNVTQAENKSITLTTATTSFYIPIEIKGDLNSESTETFSVTITSLDGLAISGSPATITINDNDSARSMYIGTATVKEGNGGTQSVDVNVTLTSPAATPVTVYYSTKDNTAKESDSDYVAASGSIEFAIGETIKPITITIKGDTNIESNERVDINISNPHGITITDDTGGINITDDDNRTITFSNKTIDEGDSNSTVNMTVTLDDFLSAPRTLYYYTTDNSAKISDNDYVQIPQATPASITLDTTHKSFSLPIQIIGDLKTESNENFRVTISSPDGLGIINPTRTLTLRNDDSRTLDINSTTVTEGNSATTNATLRISLSNKAGVDVVVNYSTTDNTAKTSDSDYAQVTSGSATIPSAIGYVDVNLNVNGDYNPESNEAFNVDITTASGITGGTRTGTVTINDDDNRTITLTGQTVTEQDVGTQTIYLDVTLDKPLPISRMLYYYTTPITADENDYVAITQAERKSVTLGTTGTSFQIPIEVKGDWINESNETFSVTITTDEGYHISGSPATVTIYDNDKRTATLSPLTVTEGDSNSTVNMTVTLSETLSAPLTLYYYTTDGTAKGSDNDYVHIPQVSPASITLDTTTRTFNIPIQIIGDLKNEGNEDISVTISAPEGLIIDAPTQVLTINNDDNRQLSVNSKTVSEGNADQTVTLTFTTSQSAGVPINVAYSTKNASATHEDGDYAELSGTTQIPAAQTSVDVSFTVKGDYKVESNEYFEVNISNNQQVPMGTSTGTITINDDDNRTLTINNMSVSEGDDPTKVINLSVDLNGSSPIDRKVYVTTANGSATGGSDFTAMAAQEVIIPHDTDPASIPITIVGDIIGEDSENFTVSITSEDGFKIAGSPATITITDDDKRTLSINSFDVNETEGSISRNFTVTLNQQLSYDLNISYQTISKTAIAGEDFTQVSGSVMIDHNTTSITIPVEILGDYKAEGDEYFEMNIGVDNIDITAPTSNGKMTLLNDDGNLSLVSSVSMAETNASSYQMPFEVRLSKAMNSPVTFRYWTTDKEANASSGDYVAVDATETFAVGETSKIVYVTINGDIAYEGDESFDLNISNDLGVTITTAGVTGTILEDDERSVAIVSGQSHDEGDAGYTDTNIIITLSEISGTDANISYTLSTSSAVAGVDFNATSGSIMIPAGQLTASIPLRIYGDITFETDETVGVHIESNTAGFAVPIPDGIFTITNDDGYFTIDDKTVYEGNVSDVTFDTIVVRLTRASTIPIDINYTMIANTATADVDYVSETGSVRLNAGDTNVTIPLTINGDGAQEGPEYFTVRISNDNNATITDTDGNVTIVDSFIDEMRVYDQYQRDFSLRISKNLYGNYAATGAPIMCVLNAAGTECDWNYSGYLGFSNTALINDDPTLGKANSSSAALDIDIETGDNIVWAGLYWQGHIESNDVEGIDSNTTGWNIITFKTPDGNTSTVTAELSDDNATDWYSFKTSINADFPGFRFFYQGFADVTNQVRNSLLNNTGRTFTVGGMNVTVGEDHDINDPSQMNMVDGVPDYDFGKVGHFGGWTLVVIREKGDTSNPDDLHNVSIFDGYKYLVSSYANPEVSMDIGINGFKTPSSMPEDGIDSQLLYFGGGSEKRFAADELNISNKSGVFHKVSNDVNPEDNPLNDTISFKGEHINANRIYNPGIDLDVIDVGEHLETNQSNTTVRLTAKSVTAGSDQTFAGLLGFSTQLYQPQLCYDFTHEQNGVHLKNVVGEKDVPTIQGRILLDSPITTGIYLRNIDSDFAIKGMSFYTDMNASKIRYDLNSTRVTRVNGVTYGDTLDESSGDCSYTASAPSEQVCLDAPDIRVGMGQRSDGNPIRYTKTTAGDIDSGSFQYVQFQTVPHNLSGDVNESLGLKLDYFIDLENGDGEILVHYTLGKNVKLCPATPIYQPQWGRFNIVDSNTSNYYNLYTQVANKDFNVSAAFYTQDGGGEYTVLANGDTTVITEIIDVDAYHDINASCANPAAAVSRQWMLRFNGQSITQLPTQTIPYSVKNAAYRVWWFDTGSSDHSTLAQGWSATTDANGDVIGISDLYQASHTECTSQCDNNTSVACYNCIKEYYSHPICSRDNFSIRPESFDIRIRDINQTSGSVLSNISENTNYIPSATPSSKMKLLSGYTYRYDVNATNHTAYSATEGYTRYFSSSSTDANVSMLWDPSSSDKNTSVCNSVDGKAMEFDLVHGQMSDGRSFYDQVGEYRVNMIDNTWTAVDFNDGNLTHHSGSGWLSGDDCIEGSGDVSGVPGSKKGCVIHSNHATSNGMGTYKDPEFVLKPYRFDLSSIAFQKGINNTNLDTAAGATNFLYMADILDDNSSQMSLKGNGSIRALSYNDANVSNFVSGCYAEDINISLFRTNIPSTSVAYKVRLQDLNGTGTVLYDANLTNVTSSQTNLFTLGEGNFTKTALGATTVSLMMNYDRNASKPEAPLVLGFDDLNVSCSSSSDCQFNAFGGTSEANGTRAMDFNVTHVYGRFVPRDVRAFGNKAFSSSGWYEVYNAPKIGTTQLTPSKNGALWYVNTLHNEAIDGDANITRIRRNNVTSTVNMSSTSSGTGIETYDFSAVGDANIPYSAKAHVDIVPWLWYGLKISPYADPSDTNLDCLTHPCFNVMVVPAIGASGSSKDTLDKTNKSSEQKGNGWHSTSDYAPAIQ